MLVPETNDEDEEDNEETNNSSSDTDGDDEVSDNDEEKSSSLALEFDLPSSNSPIITSAPPPRLNKHICFPSSSPLPSPPPKVSKHEHTLPQLDTALLQSSSIQTTNEVPLSPPLQTAAPIPRISTPQIVITFQGESCSTNFQALLLSQLKLLVNLTESLEQRLSKG
ncbi:unnamed protein product [Lactuca virosa]|uniref:Uncharacterized protein n=1 Tax=Lactuca virosa TaxID=75947 RepID=A0AAU9MY68_9ASTR|nr:unnamed protein product [Lactuca virosa]